MKFTGWILFSCFMVSISAVAAPSHLLLRSDSDEKNAISTSTGLVYVEKLPEADESRALLHLDFLSTHFRSIEIKNTQNRFLYPTEAHSYGASIGWESTPIRFLGHLGFRGDVGYEHYTADASSGDLPELRLYLIPVSVGAVYLADFHSALNYFTPALEAGGVYTTYIQSGDADGSRAQGGSLGAYAGVGARSRLSWLGLDHSLLTVGYRVQSSAFAGRTLALGLAIQM